MRCNRRLGLALCLTVVVFLASAVEARVSFSVKKIEGLSIALDSPQAIDLVDVNNDGKADILAVDPNADELDVFLNDGTGGFPGAPITYPTQANPIAVTTGDFDHDGKLDIVVLNADDNTVTVLFGDGGGPFGDARNVSLDPDNTNPVSIVAANLNADLPTDLAVLDSETIYLLKSN